MRGANDGGRHGCRYGRGVTGVRPPGSYGVDAPYVPLLSVLAAAGLALVGGWALVGAAVLAVQGVLFLHATLRGKFAAWARLLEELEAVPGTVLDVGCGRGMVAIMAARRFPEAQVTGLDLWRSQDQSGNSRDAAEANARAAGVSERLTLATGDMTDSGLAEDAYDLITANVSVHNVPTREGRRAALAEMLRSGRPGAAILIVDMRNTGEYAEDLRDLGAAGVRTRRLGPGTWFGGPWAACTLVAARVP